MSQVWMQAPLLEAGQAVLRMQGVRLQAKPQGEYGHAWQPIAVAVLVYHDASPHKHQKELFRL